MISMGSGLYFTHLHNPSVCLAQKTLDNQVWIWPKFCPVVKAKHPVTSWGSSEWQKHANMLQLQELFQSCQLTEERNYNCFWSNNSCIEHLVHPQSWKFNYWLLGTDMSSFSLERVQGGHLTQAGQLRVSAPEMGNRSWEDLSVLHMAARWTWELWTAIFHSCGDRVAGKGSLPRENKDLQRDLH